MICIHGKQTTPRGESGVYFICQFGVNKNKQCKWAKWCEDSREYESRTDNTGYLCDDFSIEIESIEIAFEEKLIEPIKEEKLMPSIKIEEDIPSPKETAIVAEREPEKKDLVSEKLKEQIINSLNNSKVELPIVDCARYLPKIQ